MKHRIHRTGRRAILAALLVLGASALPMPGHATEKSEWVAIEYYRELAESGSPDAQLTLGDLYHHGEGVPVDLVEAYAWYYVAAQQGVEEALGPMSQVLKALPEHRWGEARAKAEQYEQQFVHKRN